MQVVGRFQNQIAIPCADPSSHSLVLAVAWHHAPLVSRTLATRTPGLIYPWLHAPGLMHPWLLHLIMPAHPCPISHHQLSYQSSQWPHQSSPLPHLFTSHHHCLIIFPSFGSPGEHVVQITPPNTHPHTPTRTHAYTHAHMHKQNTQMQTHKHMHAHKHKHTRAHT